ncbi:hypothetical protein OHC33_010925 [Knufia fluminis]|uniref:Zn(2)-C6 fungal-type domain-containing protein n=1 Tax=Knufia fluminis TaxID=191047 RepID=A0AAN8ECI2_9EURO|nr:hypothetical protein OHC33_010925 [Knufia fluminis]
MQSFQASGVSAQGPKNYVFVDEHNRHKRLKVMRACEGCRRRKIKCDAATTNSWPCAACKRLKLTCVPPVGGLDGELGEMTTTDEPYISQSSSTPVQQYPPEQFQYLHNYGSQSDLDNYSQYDGQTSQNLFTQPNLQYARTPHGQGQGQLVTPQQAAYPQHRYRSFDSVNGNVEPQSVGSPQSTDSITAEELAENLGDLRIADTGIAPYIRHQNGSQKEAAAPIVEDEEDFPAFSTAAGSQIRIPPPLMPSNEEASRAFQDFFRHVHPYVPVLCRSHFYHLWQKDRNAISPLLLEAVLACAGQVSDDPAGGSQWLALANRHEENFADMPRLSTIQALLLLLKAREKTPKRGYYYRSWITVKKIVGMAKDLDLHEHYDLHESGGQCDSTPVECLSKTRVWQLAMMVEVMVGGPQGRSDYGVDIDTIDISPSPPNSDIDDYEKTISRQFAYWVRNVRNIRGMTETYHKLKRKKKEWASDPIFVAYNENFRKWPAELPEDLRVSIPVDGTLPKLPSHYLANVHCHYQLGIVMLYKPQLNASKDFMNDEKWKHIMSLCYTSAKQVCIYQEAILDKYEILGLACMQRGLSFPIYAILSCVMIHLVAITSPETAYNHDAKGFFIRHMRVLERCILEWPMPEVEAQINGLRAAFSVDLNKPFDLKPTFPYGTPSEHSKSPEERRSSEPQQHFQNSQEQQFYQQSMQHNTYFQTPAVSAVPTTRPQAPQFRQDYHEGPTNQQYHQMASTNNPNNATPPTEQWNPTPIINQFNTAFAIPQSALAPPPPSSYSSSPPINLPQQSLHLQMQNQQFVPSPTSATPYSAHPYTPSPTSQPMPNPQAFFPPYSRTGPQPQMAPGHYSQQQPANSYFEPGMNQQPDSSQMSGSGTFAPSNINFSPNPESAGASAPVYVTPKEWQQSVASVFDPSGLKRKWGYEQQLPVAMQQQGHPSGRYGNAG